MKAAYHIITISICHTWLQKRSLTFFRFKHADCSFSSNTSYCSTFQNRLHGGLVCGLFTSKHYIKRAGACSYIG